MATTTTKNPAAGQSVKDWIAEQESALQANKD